MATPGRVAVADASGSDDRVLGLVIRLSFGLRRSEPEALAVSTSIASVVTELTPLNSSVDRNIKTRQRGKYLGRHVRTLAGASDW